jgi:membrane-bound lytic murein transglycosylase B
MQFLPSTWHAYGADGDGDGSIDVTNSVDAVHGAARLLCANGGGDPERLASAVWNYNHSDDYVRRVLALAGSVTS